jgi:LuxR family maltose regulon positive regulatory protein
MFPYDDFRSSLAAGERLGELVGDDPVLQTASRLGRARAHYFLGDPASAREALPDCGRETAAERPMASALTPAIRSLLELDDGDIGAGVRLAQEAVDVANAVGVAEVGTLATAWVALGKALAATGDLVEAEAALERAVAMASTPADALFAANALLALARVRAALGSPADARKLLVKVRAIVEPAPEPGTLRAQLEELERRLSTRTRRAAALDELPTESELRVLRLMAGDATRAEIATRLFLSSNTVKSHQRALYRKLGASNREDAVGRARELGLV